MSMAVMVVDGVRHLINTVVSDKQQDETCERILSDYPSDCIIEWDEVRKSDVINKEQYYDF